MLLNLLSKEEKFYFIDLLGLILSADGPANDIEVQIIKKLKFEMGDEATKYRKSNLSIEKLIEYFAQKSKTVKNLVLYNLISASLFDEFYSVEEHFLMEQVQNDFGISNKKKTELMKAVYAERDMREKVKRIISE